jgi:hypothetical protein
MSKQSSDACLVPLVQGQHIQIDDVHRRLQIVDLAVCTVVLFGRSFGRSVEPRPIESGMCAPLSGINLDKFDQLSERLEQTFGASSPIGLPPMPNSA